jgi:3-oxoadipate CoA-transferase, beta subunit
VFVMMDLLTKKGASKLVERCTSPLTGVACVKRVYTDHATFDITADGVVARDLVAGLTVPALEQLCGLTFKPA